MRTSLLAVAITCMLGGVAMAQPGGERGQRGGGFDPQSIIDRIMENDDKNNDGKIAKDEAGDRMKDRFDSIDGDGDGFITQDELKKSFSNMRGGQSRGGQSRGGQGRGGEGGGPGRGGEGGGAGDRGPGGPGGAGGRGPGGSGMGRLLSMLPMMVALDKNKDGELSKREIEGATAALKSLDKNKDGVLSMEELSPDMSQMRGGRGGPEGRGGRGGAEGGSRGGRGGPGGREGGGTRPKRPAFDDDGDNSPSQTVSLNLPNMT